MAKFQNLDVTHCLILFLLDERNDWINTILSALKSHTDTSQARPTVAPERSGYLELKGYKAKIFTLLQGNNVWICKNEQVKVLYLFVDGCL